MKKSNKKNNFQSKRGFTLIEIMVSLALFAVVAVIAVGAFLRIINADKQAQSLQTAMNNTDFALDSMVRDMRVGTNYDCLPTGVSVPATLTGAGTTDCTFSPGKEVAFISSTKSADKVCNLIHAYRLSSVNILEKAEQTSCNDSFSVNDFLPLTSSDLHIQSFEMQVTGDGTTIQPKVFFMIKAYAGPTQQDRTYFTVQTSASERSMNGS